MTPAEFAAMTTDEMVWSWAWFVFQWLGYMTFCGAVIGLAWQYLDRALGRP